MMGEKERLQAARKAWREGNIDELRWIFGEMDLDIDAIMENTFRESLCGGKNFD